MRGLAAPPHPGIYRVPSPGFLEAHDDKNPLNAGQFHVLKKCHVKFDRHSLQDVVDQKTQA